jgi:hypothetical protein
MLMPAPFDFLDQVRWLLRPDERGGVIIPRVDVVLNMRHEGPHGIERSAPDGFPRQDAEPDFDQVQPRGTGCVK